MTTRCKIICDRIEKYKEITLCGQHQLQQKCVLDLK